MVLLNSDVCDFNKKMINFHLMNIDGQSYNLDNLLGKNGTLIMFICNHCPYVKAVIKELVKTTIELTNYGINSIAIMPNDIEKYPEDNFEKMQKFADINNFNFPYLIDDTQEIAKKYEAVCTPDFFGFNQDKKLQYRGRIFELNNLKITSNKNELLDAMKMISKHKTGPTKQYPSIGCSIKWK